MGARADDADDDQSSSSSSIVRKIGSRPCPPAPHPLSLAHSPREEERRREKEGDT